MNWKQHILFGFVFNIPIFLLFLNFGIAVNIFLSLLVIFIYSQLPDIDTRASQIRWLVTVSCSVLAFLSLVIFDNRSWAIISIGILIIVWILGFIKCFKHRGLTHSIFMAVLISFPLVYYSLPLAAMGLVAYLSHLSMDRKHKKKKR